MNKIKLFKFLSGLTGIVCSLGLISILEIKLMSAPMLLLALVIISNLLYGGFTAVEIVFKEMELAKK